MLGGDGGSGDDADADADADAGGSENDCSMMRAVIRMIMQAMMLK